MPYVNRGFVADIDTLFDLKIASFLTHAKTIKNYDK